MAHATTSDPPVYNLVSTSETEEKPPSYFDVVGQLKAVKSEAKSPTDLIVKLVGILCASCIFSILIAICQGWNIAGIFIGLIYRYDCIVQDYIPIWLIINGICGLLLSTLRLIQNSIELFRKRKGENQSGSKALACVINLIYLFVFIWFILGNIWVYEIYSSVRYDKQFFPANYCHSVCYRFAFWSITLTWIFLGLICICACGCICIALGGIGLALKN